MQSVTSPGGRGQEIEGEIQSSRRERSATLRRPVPGRDVVKIRERVLDDLVNYVFNTPSYLRTTFIERRVIGNLDLIKICVVRLRRPHVAFPGIEYTSIVGSPNGIVHRLSVPTGPVRMR